MTTQSVEITLDGMPCLAWNEDYDDIADLATSYRNPLGPEPGIAYCLMLAKDLALVNRNAPLELNLSAGGAVGLSGLWFHSAVCVSGGSRTEGNRAYLVTLLDSRAILNKFSDIQVEINVRCPAPAAATTDGSNPLEFYAQSLNGATPHTWNSAIGAIWNSLPASIMGAYPGLPMQPYGIPQNLRYNGVNGWLALHEALGKLGLTTAYDPQNDKFAIVDLTQDQPGLAAAQAANSNTQLEDDAPLGANPIFFPETIRVYFHRQAQHFGTEPDTPQASNWSAAGQLNWGDIPTGQPGAVPGTRLALFDDLPAIVDFNGATTNSAAGISRAAEVVDKWVAGTLERMNRQSVIYQGIVPEFDTPGSQVSMVSYHNLRGSGFVTEIELKPDFPGVRAISSAAQATGENFQTSDLARHTTPIYPRNVQLIQLATNQPDSNGLYLANVVRTSPANNFSGSGSAPPVDLEQCWAAESTPKAKRRRETCAVYYGRINGVATGANGETLPLYLLESGAGQTVLGKTAARIDYQAIGSVDIFDGPVGQETDTGVNVQITNPGATILPGDSVTFAADCGGVRMPMLAPTNRYGQANAPAIGTTPTTVSATFPGNQITVTIWENGQATQNTLQAWVRHVPIIDTEFVNIDWTGKEWVATAADYDGILATYAGTNSQAIMATGGGSSQFKIALAPGAEPTTAISFQVSNRIGPVLANTKLWIGRNANRFYVATGHVTSIYGQVKAANISQSSPLGAIAVGSTATIQVFQNGADTGATIQALVEHCPIIETEFVHADWDGLQWIVTRGDYDGGVNGKYIYPNAALAKGASSEFFLLQLYPSVAPDRQISFQITCQLGSIPVDKLVRISRDATGFWATAGEC